MSIRAAECSGVQPIFKMPGARVTEPVRRREGRGWPNPAERQRAGGRVATPTGCSRLDDARHAGLASQPLQRQPILLTAEVLAQCVEKYLVIRGCMGE